MKQQIKQIEELLESKTHLLQRREADLQALLDNMPAMIGYWDSNLINRFGNHAYRDWFGIDPATMPGKHIREVIGEERYQLNRPYIEAVLRGERQSFERVIPGPDGAARTAKAEYIPDVKDGKVVGFFVLVSDITQLKATQTRLQESETYLRTLIDHEPECIKTVDEQGCLVDMNPAGLAMIEASAETALGSDVLSVIAPEHREAFWAMHQKVVAGEAQTLEFEIIGLKGARRWVETHAVPFQTGDRRLHLAVTRDISKRKAAQAALKKSNEELEHFVHAASHDLRQPLRMVSAFLGLLDKSLKDRLSEDEKSYLDFAKNGAQRMSTMIDDLTDFSRLCRNEPRPEAVDLNIAVERAVQNLFVAISESAADVAVIDKLPVVVGAASELERLFQNLIGNGVKFQKTGNRPIVRINCRDHGDHWDITVADNGIGIDPAYLDRLFQPFQRLVALEDYAGSGIGLAACRKIAEHHGGRIWVESDLGCGSRFHLAFPKRKGDS